jgi:predicted AAA+ superfamily ATPase
MARANAERVGEALELLSSGLAPFVRRECRAQYGEGWLDEVAPKSSHGQPSADDIHFLLKTIWDQWEAVFGKVLSQTERTLVSELRETRNRWAHQEAFSTDDAYRTIDSTHRLLQAISAGEEAELTERLKQELLRARFDEQARRTRRRAAETAIEGQPDGSLKPWREIATPHRDVASGAYQQAEFAADLHQVWRGEAAEEYGVAQEFFRRTFVTDGLRRLLVNATRRLSGSGGDPVVDLQTNFGGGKTHSLIALYHLAGAGPGAARLAGLDEVLVEAGTESIPEAKRAVLVGTMIGPANAHVKDDGTEVRTLWGELAWQLGGRQGFDLVAEADERGTNPGERLVELLRAHAPCLILIDEWIAYARQLYGTDGLPAGSFDAQFTFAQALSEAVKSVPDAHLVVAIPASDIEVGGEAGRAALDRLRNVVERTESPWRPASADEGFEIVRRRLFEPLDPTAARQRDVVVGAYSDMYRREAVEFPAHAREANYARRMTSSYPIHPELFDRLFNAWSELERFQRTRGVLRLMAAVIHELWERQDAGLLVSPASVPIDAASVGAELTRYLEEGWDSVIESDVDGPNSLPLRLDRENPSLGRYSAARRVARSIYMGSAPVQAAANRGIDDRSLKLGCVQPGEPPAVFGDALRRLGNVATYLYADGRRHWFARQPSVTSTAKDRASQFSEDEVREEIERRLRPTRERAEFAAVHAAPASPSDVPDEPSARLVMLGPADPHSGKTADSPARDLARLLLDERGTGPRRYRNALVFLAADQGRLADVGEAVRSWLAWRSIDEDSETLNLDAVQSKQVEAKRAEFDHVVDARISEAWQWLIVPSVHAEEPTGPVHWEVVRVAGSEAPALRAVRKLKAEEGLVTEYSGVRLRLDLDRFIWTDRNHVGVRELAEAYGTYLYLPRLRDPGVLVDAIANGVSVLTWQEDTFAYAQAFDEEAGRYKGLAAGVHVDVVIDSSAMAVKPELAARQLEAMADLDKATSASIERGEPGASEPAGPPSEADRGRPTRFYGRLELDPVRFLRQMSTVSDELVAALSRDGSKLRLTLELEAESSEGYPDDTQRTVTENAATLKFDLHQFDE